MESPAIDLKQNLTPEEESAFVELGLAQGDWVALLPVPFLGAAWEDHFLSEDERRLVRLFIEQIQSDWLQNESQPGSEDARHARRSFYGDLLWEGDSQPEAMKKLDLAFDLLAWFLAHRCTFDERQQLLERFRQADLRRVIPRDYMQDAIRDLRRKTDKYLACDHFSVDAQEVVMPEPSVRDLALIGDATWQAMLMTPLAQLVFDAQGPDNRLRYRMEDQIRWCLQRPRSRLRVLADEFDWVTLFHFLVNSRQDSARERFDACRLTLVEGLAKLSLDVRDEVIDELREIASTLRRHRLWRYFENEQIDAVFVPLPALIDAVRLRHAGRIAKSQRSQPGETAALSTDDDTNNVEDEPLVAESKEDLSPTAAESTKVVQQAGVADKIEETTDAPTPEELVVHQVAPDGMVDWQQCLEAAAIPNVDEMKVAVEQPLLFSEHRNDGESIVVVPAERQLPQSLWFIGDVHCDLLSLANTWRFIEQISASEGTQPHAVFLGDFLDRGERGIETLAFLFRLLAKHPGQIAVVPGNHDEFVWNEQAQRFEIGVEPAETIIELNEIATSATDQSRQIVEMAKQASAFFAALPRAIFLPDGSMLAHGGFPHADLLDSLQSRADLSSPQCVQDFVWLRAVNARRKLPSRFSRGSEYGRENFQDFCVVADERLGIPVRRLIRGHDHIRDRYQAFTDWPNPVLTINAMGRNIGEWGVPPFPSPCVARHRLNQLPEVYQLQFDESEFQRAYPPKVSTEEE